MKATSQKTTALLLAHEAGYRVNSDGVILNPRGGIVAGYHRRGGYREFSIKLNGKTLHVSVHRLAAFQKFGDALFTDGIQTRHLDGNPANNSHSNIAIGTATDNHFDKPVETRRRCATTASHCFHNQSRWTAIDADRMAGMSYKQLRAKHGVQLGTLSYRYSKTKIA